MVAVSHLILLACTATALVFPRDAAKIRSDLKVLNSDYIALKQADEAYTKGGSSIDIQNAVDKVELDTKEATADARASSNLSQPDSQAIAGYISNTLEPSIHGAIKTTVANKEQVAKAGLTAVVQAEQKQLKADTDDLGKALVAITPTEISASKLKAAFTKVDRDYDEGIAAFSRVGRRNSTRIQPDDMPHAEACNTNATVRMSSAHPTVPRGCRYRSKSRGILQE